MTHSSLQFALLEVHVLFILNLFINEYIYIGVQKKYTGMLNFKNITGTACLNVFFSASC